METLNLKFPHLSELIFDHLDNQSLSHCKIVSKSWSIYIRDQKFYGGSIWLKLRVLATVVALKISILTFDNFFFPHFLATFIVYFEITRIELLFAV